MEASKIMTGPYAAMITSGCADPSAQMTPTMHWPTNEGCFFRINCFFNKRTEQHFGNANHMVGLVVDDRAERDRVRDGGEEEKNYCREAAPIPEIYTFIIFLFDFQRLVQACQK